MRSTLAPWLAASCNVLFARQGKHKGQVLGYSPYMQSDPCRYTARISPISIAEVEVVGATMTSLSGRLVNRRGVTLEQSNRKSTRAATASLCRFPIASQQMLRDICGPAHTHLQLLEHAFAEDDVRVDSQASERRDHRHRQWRRR